MFPLWIGSMFLSLRSTKIQRNMNTAKNYLKIWKIREKCLSLQCERRNQVEPRCAERWHLCDDEQFDLAAWFPSLKYRAGHEWPAFIVFLCSVCRWTLFYLFCVWPWWSLQVLLSRGSLSFDGSHPCYLINITNTLSFGSMFLSLRSTLCFPWPIC